MRQARGLVVGAGLVLGLGGALRAAVSTETVTSVGVSTVNAAASALVLDGRNNLFMIFVDSSTEKLKYGILKNGAGVWEIGTVADPLVAPSCDLALAPDGTVHAAFYQTQSPAGVGHAVWDGASWQTDTVEEFVGTHTFVSIAVGSDNRPWVLYNDSSLQATVLRRYSTGWVLQSSVPWTGGPCALALETGGLPRYVTVNDFDGSRYVTLVVVNSSGSYSSVEFFPSGVADPRGESQKVGLAIDSAGQSHASFYDEESGGLLYASVIGTTPTITSVDSSVDAGMASDIVVDSHDKPRVIYFSRSVGLREAVLGATWSLSTLDPGEENGWGPSVVSNRYNHFFASYLDGDTGAVKWVTDAAKGLSISGAVRDLAGPPIANVVLTIFGSISSSAVPVSSVNGDYVVSSLLEGNYTLTPSVSGRLFEPTSYFYPLLTTSQWNQNFKGGAVFFWAENAVFYPGKGESVTFHYATLGGEARLKIYSLHGELVRTWVDGVPSLGAESISWDGRDEEGRAVASGTYLVEFEAGHIRSSKKVVILK